MGSLFGLFLTLCAGFWLFMAARGMARELKRADRFKWIVGVMYVLILIGATGFFAAALSAVGVLKLPTSREWCLEESQRLSAADFLEEDFWPVEGFNIQEQTVFLKTDYFWVARYLPATQRERQIEPSTTTNSVDR